MGKKPQRHSWPEAKALCRINQDDIEMAKRLGFGPDALVRARPDPKQRWKLPVKDWVRELHQKRFGHVIGEKPLAPVPEWDEVAPGRLSRMEEILPPDGDWPRDEDVPF